MKTFIALGFPGAFLFGRGKFLKADPPKVKGAGDEADAFVFKSLSLRKGIAQIDVVKI